MKKYIHSNDYEIYEIIKFNNKWVIVQAGVYAGKSYNTLSEAKKAIDNQEVYF